MGTVSKIKFDKRIQCLIATTKSNAHLQFMRDLTIYEANFPDESE